MKIVVHKFFSRNDMDTEALNLIVRRLAEDGDEVRLITSRGEALYMPYHSRIKRRCYSYKISADSFEAMVEYCRVQLKTFFMSFRYLLSPKTIFYINTILPIGPALAGRLMGKKVVYHYHENAFIKGRFYRILTAAMQRLATHIICVSEYQRSFLTRTHNVTVIPNGNPQLFVSKLKPNPTEAFGRKHILMLGSLKEYKSVPEFVKLANEMPEYKFTIVINDLPYNIKKFFREKNLTISRNLMVYPQQIDVTPFYNNASLVLNLSDKTKFIETFGLTAIEAMAAGLPVIVPTVGGIAEIVQNGRNGYKIDVANLSAIKETIRTILSDSQLYCQLANNALQTSSQFHEDKCIEAIKRILQNP